MTSLFARVPIVKWRPSLALLLLFGLSPLASPPATADQGWRGFQNGGRLTTADPKLPVSWSPQTGIAWQTPLAGYGQSSPVVQDSRVYVTSTSGEMKEQLHIQALDLTSGQQVWRHDARNSTPEKNSNYISRAAPSPVCDSSGVVALFEGGNLLALSPEGKVRWQRDLVADYGPITARHGLASSLEQDEKQVYAWIEREENPYVLALSKQTGKTVWKAAGLGVTSWSSPRLIAVGSGRHLVLSGLGKLCGIDPETGERVWEFDDISGNSTPTPIPLGEGRFLIGASEGRGESGVGKAAASNGVLQIESPPEGGFRVRWLWRADKATCSFGSPIAHQGYAYFVNRSGVVYCLDLKTGKQQYTQRTSGSIWASPLIAENRLYLFGRDGTTTIIGTGPQFQLQSVNKLWEPPPAEQAESGTEIASFGGPVLYAATAVGPQLILRRGDVVYAIRRDG